ncbi:phage portal protein [Kurthia senegalensis]|uniref:phage portal protein n=1 Tax=Kurthia senegalensis TaxID=1033740 RepID=UPI0002883842|nr:phage portal protein [Kurthia senegalensis]
MFNNQARQGTQDAFLDVLVSMVSDDDTMQYSSIKAMRNSDVFAAVKIISSDIASSDLLAENKETNLTKLINNNPNEYMSAWHYKFSQVANMLLNGNAFSLIERDEKGEPIALHPLLNSKVTIEQSDDGKVHYIHSEDGEKSILDALNVLHFKYFSTDGLTGVSPLYALHDELKLQERGNKLLAGFFKRGVNGSGILKIRKSNLDKKAKEAIRQKFEEANAGDANTMRTVILDEEMDYTPVQINTDILKLVNNNDWNTKQIAKVFGLSTDRLGVEANHSNTIQSNVMYLRNTLTHFLKAIESEINFKLNSPKRLKFSTEWLISEPQQVYENDLKAVRMGVMSVEEMRKKLGLKEKNEDDTFHSPTKESEEIV